eukprot:m.1599161 g.1599161  ORF g.1599161 m.1599161 type:complete len:352 (-) comp25346_c0_seq16:2229-3284(-)
MTVSSKVQNLAVDLLYWLPDVDLRLYRALVTCCRLENTSSCVVVRLLQTLTLRFLDRNKDEYDGSDTGIVVDAAAGLVSFLISVSLGVTSVASRGDSESPQDDGESHGSNLTGCIVHTLDYSAVPTGKIKERRLAECSADEFDSFWHRKCDVWNKVADCMSRLPCRGHVHGLLRKLIPYRTLDALPVDAVVGVSTVLAAGMHGLPATEHVVDVISSAFVSAGTRMQMALLASNHAREHVAACAVVNNALQMAMLGIEQRVLPRVLEHCQLALENCTGVLHADAVVELVRTAAVAPNVYSRQTWAQCEDALLRVYQSAEGAKCSAMVLETLVSEMKLLHGIGAISSSEVANQ